MARIRTIKPEFWTDGKMVKISRCARLFYIGMWNFACDSGHLPDDPLGLRLKIMPADGDVNPDEMVAELVNMGAVERLETHEGRPYLRIKRFKDHQKVDPRWNSRCPYCLAESPEDSPKLPEARPSSGKESKGKDSKTHLPKTFGISDRVQKWANEKGYTRLNEHLEAFKLKAQAKGYKYTDWDAAFMEAIRKNWAGITETAEPWDERDAALT